MPTSPKRSPFSTIADRAARSPRPRAGHEDVGQAVAVPPVPNPGLKQPIPALLKAGIGCLTSEYVCPEKTETPAQLP
ncbi:hypothetical protein GCM10018966_007090 [Streptomyces yanii]